MSSPEPYLKPGFLQRRLVNPLLLRLGLATTLAVRGRRSGEWRQVPVNVLELGGERFLVSTRGNSEWVRNLRAAGSGELRRGGRTEPFTAAEADDVDKPPIIEAYLARWGGRVRREFEALPDPAHHPVFRIEGSPRQR
jgi:deazaflavin-dependent oxidoreductase (nitroreductase family)